MWQGHRGSWLHAILALKWIVMTLTLGKRTGF